MSEEEDLYTKIIDTHAHIGHWSADNVDFTEETLQEAFDEPFEISVCGEPEENEVVAVMVSNMSGIDTNPDGSPCQDEFETNREMLDICAENPKFKALIVGQPGYGNAEKLVRLIEERGDEIYGIKLHPNTLMLDANDPLYEPYLSVAQEYGLPVLFHSQDNWSSPVYIYETAQKFPDVPVILAHMGMGSDENHYFTLGLLTAALRSGTANLYADISWLSPETIVNVLRMVDEDILSHLLWGTDIPLGPFGDPAYYPQRVSEVKSAIVEEFGDDAPEIIERLFFTNAYDLFLSPKEE